MVEKLKIKIDGIDKEFDLEDKDYLLIIVLQDLTKQVQRLANRI